MGSGVITRRKGTTICYIAKKLCYTGGFMRLLFANGGAGRW
jgi:hypothetical protein